MKNTKSPALQVASNCTSCKAQGQDHYHNQACAHFSPYASLISVMRLALGFTLHLKTKGLALGGLA
jgi:hypothetical protein